jgi:histidinol dehydrogenase
MMKLIKNPPKDQWKELLKRPGFDAGRLREKVLHIIDEVRRDGDAALRKFSLEFDGVQLNDFAVSSAEINNSASAINTELKEAIKIASANIRKYHQSQMPETKVIETMPGVRCWQRSVGIERVGLYIPGGTAPLFSTVLMLAIPAAIAGCREIILFTPPGKNGQVHPAILYAASLSGVKKIYKTGGAQAIAAMAYGTETIDPVYKIFGPGNQYVNCAKQLVQLDGVAIDMPAGPSEVCILADESSNPSFIAADLLSQAEHGADSQVLLVSTSSENAELVLKQLERQLVNLPRRAIALEALQKSNLIIFESPDLAIDIVNEYAAEHLIICCKSPEEVSLKVINAGSVFIGNYSPEAVGDYASGTNHTLPTNGFARSHSGITLDSFIKKISYQQLTVEGLISIAKHVEVMAMAEGLEAHARAVSIRM